MLAVRSKDWSQTLSNTKTESRARQAKGLAQNNLSVALNLKMPLKNGNRVPQNDER